MREQRPAQIEFSADVPVQAVLQVLSHDFTQHELLGKVLRADADSLLVSACRTDCAQGQRDAAHLFSSQPKPPSAARASSAAGTAPARICTLSTEAMPRKM